MKTSTELKNTVLQLEKRLQEVNSSLIIINGGTQQNFSFHMGDYRLQLSHTDRGYMQVIKPHYDRVRVALESALLDEKCELIDLIKVARSEVKEALQREADQYV